MFGISLCLLSDGLCDLVYDSLILQAEQQNQQLRRLEILRQPR
jgi:hypothetical protein